VNNQLKANMFVMDSVSYSNPDSILYFYRKQAIKGAGNCGLPLIPHALNQVNNPDFIDSLTKRNDTVFWHSNYSNLPFYFLTDAMPGQSWTITSTNSSNDYDQIVISCTSVQLQTFFGVTDSVKIFNMVPNGSRSNQVPVSNFQMSLSKNYGLLEFVPFYRFMYHPAGQNFYSLKLIGFENSTSQEGYQQPGFSNYFHLAPGDILLWHRYVNPDDITMPDYDVYYLDSITQSVITIDSVVYTFNRTIKDAAGVITQINNDKISIYRNQYEDILCSPPRWLASGINQYSLYGSLWNSEDLLLQIDSINNDTITVFPFSIGQGFVTTNCTPYFLIDLWNIVEFNSRSGVKKYCNMGFGSDCTELIGYKIDGIQNGGITLGLTNLNVNNLISIYPNPVKDVLVISSERKELGEIKIYNVIGKLLYDKYMPGISTEINVEKLTVGIYFIEVAGTRMKLVKE
jgi:hypothetical protein